MYILPEMALDGPWPKPAERDPEIILVVYKGAARFICSSYHLFKISILVARLTIYPDIR